MDYEGLVEEMSTVASRRVKPQDTSYFTIYALDEESIILGCERILSWLRALSVSMRIRPFRLKRNDLDITKQDRDQFRRCHFQPGPTFTNQSSLPGGPDSEMAYRNRRLARERVVERKPGLTDL